MYCFTALKQGARYRLGRAFFSETAEIIGINLHLSAALIAASQSNLPHCRSGT
jgi:hypothetical protein